jgi:predicted dithiol-disulfide oxidoreductase (DUF899 family)
MSVARKTKTKKKAPARGLHATRFPGEKPAYRSARDTLLKEEVKLRRQIEAVAARRRKLPLGGALKEDYVFETGGGAAVHFSELFADGKDTLLVYSFMFGPEMKSACSSCTSMLDGLEGQAPHITQRANLVVVAKSRAGAAGATSGCCRHRAAPTTATTTAKPQTARRSRR